jgi:hypothetical protein
LFNEIYAQVDDFGTTIQIADLDIKVCGGRSINTSQADITIPDQELTLNDNTTSYIYFDNLNNVFAIQELAESTSYWTCAKITTL